MSIQVALRHVTTYRYDRRVALGPQVVRLRPAPHCRARIASYALKVEPAEHFVNWQQDPQANWLARFVFQKAAAELRVEVDLVADIEVVNPFDFFLEPRAESWPFSYAEAQLRELRPYLEVTPHGRLFDAFVATISRTPSPTNDFLVELNRRLAEHVRYVIRLEPGLQTPEETLELRSGSCRDTAWLLVQILRSLGLAARFVSGYLVQLAPDQKPLDGPAGPSHDFVDLHAWCDVYLPGAGWIGLDPTSGLLAGEGHLPLACAPEPASAAPIEGLVDPCEATLEHEMSIARVVETPRVTKPYDEATWGEIDALGRAVDAALDAGDVRLTMGGEPTFVAVDDPDGEEWNTAALGPTKKRLAADLFWRLRDRYASKGLVHFGQGKWYPGEPLPRWALSCFWRRDGEPLWEDASLVADEARPAAAGVDAALAERFLRGVAERLGVGVDLVFPAFEDVFYYLWREHRLPVNVDPFDARLDDAMERERLARVFSQGLGAAVGHVLPITRGGAAGARWRSGAWHLRGERCLLTPGDSPLGFRLPLASQPWAVAEDRPRIQTPDPMVDPGGLPSRASLRMQQPVPRGPEHDGGADGAPAAFASARDVVRTAMCVEPRGGVLYVFMPPVEALEDYVELAAAVEATADALRQPVLLEGYPPPRDRRLASFSVTPDPGVIEVNVHPSASWGDLVDHTTHLYEAARTSRLSAERFLVDGRHTGTGGGNHVVLGGATPEDSPFLRRPDLLPSLVSSWLQHPSLSFLFSGLFIGPTSQSPRVDEARTDAVREVEIAFAELARRAPPGEQAPPWVVDCALRDLLVDATGNTHRTEICIDKLFSPDGATGRLGLVEMRAFEMPPHARMSLAQQLLVRAQVARFWARPFAPARLARWGTELHDRFMLPHFVWQDLEDVTAELAGAGFPLQAAWFSPHFELRFPKLGDVAARGIELEVRGALEPWHVTGEDGAPGGTARYVDSSLERLQVKVSGMAPDRYVVACNGRALPLTSTGRAGEFVAGVRYRAWQPPRCLHPTIGVHAPLAFDIVDTWMERSLGGCQYHVAHPGGRSHDTRPINAFEAEGRRLARFFRMGHTPGPMRVAPAERSLDFPFTLDLRAP